MKPTANWGTLYRLVMSQGRSEKNIEKIKSEFELCSTDEERDAVLSKYQGSVKSAGQNKEFSAPIETKAIVSGEQTEEADGDEEPVTETVAPLQAIKPEKKGLVGKKKVLGKKG